MLSLMFTSLSFTLLVRLGLAASSYQLQDSYTPSTFFDKFNFFTGPDPTEGFVTFVDQSTAQSSGLISTSSDAVKFGVDASNVTPNGRPSIRLESKQSYNQGLIIADIAHMPGGICGTWPAFWTIGPDWPANGEIDIIEGVNSQTSNAMTLHTAPGCSISSNTKMAGVVATSDCDINAPGQGDNVGCGIKADASTTYGTGFNSAGGGVYATEWTSEAITIHYFARGQIPADIASGKPDPTSWGLPLAKFTGCNFPNAIRNQTIIFDNTFCGQWAGEQSVWSSDAVCSQKAATCQDFVQNNPSAFSEAFWQVNSVKVYQLGDGFIGSSPIPSSSAAATSTSGPIPTTFATSPTAAIPSSAIPTSAIPASVVTSAPLESSFSALSTSFTMVTVEQTTTMTADSPAATSTPVFCDESHTSGCIAQTRGGGGGDFSGRFSFSRNAKRPAPSKRALHGHEHAHAHARRHAHGHAHA